MRSEIFPSGIETKASSATITKVNAWINRGGAGFKEVIQKLPLKYEYPEKLSPGPIEYHLPEAILKSIQYAMANSQDKRIKKLAGEIGDKKRFDSEFRQKVNETYIRKLPRNITL